MDIVLTRFRSFRVYVEAILWRRARPVLAVYWPALAVATHYPPSDLDPISFADSGYDRPAHAACFAILTLLLLYTQQPQRSPWARLWLATTVAGLYAFADEFTQGWFGRSIEMADLVANFVGIILIAAIAWLAPPQADNTPYSARDEEMKAARPSIPVENGSSDLARLDDPTTPDNPPSDAS